MDPSKLPVEVRELQKVSDKVDKPKFTREQLSGYKADFQDSMTVVPVGKMLEGLLAQALKVHLAISVEGYELEQVYEDEQVDEVFLTKPIPEHEVPDPAPRLILQGAYGSSKGPHNRTINCSVVAAQLAQHCIAGWSTYSKTIALIVGPFIKHHCQNYI